jgi:hypothetical protein
MPLSTNEMPSWARDTFNSFLDDLKILSEVVSLSVAGISMVRATPKAIRALNFSGAPDFSEDSLSDNVKMEIKISEHRAALAQREVDSEFTIIHSQGVLSLWSALEDVIRDLLARWLLNLPEKRLESPWCDLKVKLGEYERLDEEQKAYFLVAAIEQSTASALKRGVNRFETMLDTIQLSGPIDDNVKVTIHEMQQVRNVVAHRRGVADARFCAACPQFGLSIGQKLRVGHKQWHQYTDAIGAYILEIIYRTGEKFGDNEIRERSLRPKASRKLPELT